MATIIGFDIDAPHLLLLKRQHAETMGEVTRLLPETHGLVEIKYEVSGVAYQRALPVQTHPVAEGDSVRVYYSPRDPTIAFLASPGEILADQLPSWIVGSLLMSVGLVTAVLTLWSPSAPFHRFSVLVTSPKVLSAGVTIGVLSSLLLSLFSGTLKTATLIGGVFVVGGCMIFLMLAWRRKLSWAGLLHSKEFGIAFTLVVVGNILNSIF